MGTLYLWVEDKLLCPLEDKVCCPMIPGKRYHGLQILVFIGFAGFLNFSDTKMMNCSKWFAGYETSNFISVIFVF